MKRDYIISPEAHIGGTAQGLPTGTQKPDCAKAIAFGAVRDELIRQTAYSCYQARNCVGGNALQDWLRAEKLVNQMPGKMNPTREPLVLRTS